MTSLDRPAPPKRKPRPKPGLAGVSIWAVPGLVRYVPLCSETMPWPVARYGAKRHGSRKGYSSLRALGCPRPPWLLLTTLASFARRARCSECPLGPLEIQERPFYFRSTLDRHFEARRGFSSLSSERPLGTVTFHYFIGLAICVKTPNIPFGASP